MDFQRKQVSVDVIVVGSSWILSILAAAFARHLWICESSCIWVVASHGYLYRSSFVIPRSSVFLAQQACQRDTSLILRIQ